MAKKKRRTKSSRPQRPRSSPELDLLDALRAGLDSPTPGPLLGVVGLLLSVASAADDPVTARDELVRSFSAAEHAETSAALLAIACLTGDPELRRRARREIAEHGHVLPRWLAELHHGTPVDRAVEMSTVFRAADTLIVGVTLPGGHPLTAVVRIDNELGTVATDGYVVESPLDVVVELLSRDDDPDSRTRDASPADARARLTRALDEIDLGPGKVNSEQLDESRPLVEWMLSLLPEGGADGEPPELSEDELDGIAEGFLASPFGPSWADGELRPLLDEVLAAGSTNGIGDPLVWSRRNVGNLLAPRWRFFDDATPHLDRAPELLRDLIRHGHAERGLRLQLTMDALSEVDAHADAFRATVRAIEEDDDET